MAEDLQIQGPQDRSRINLYERWELHYRAKQLGCTPDEREAVAEADSAPVETVRKQLGKEARRPCPIG